MSASGGTGGAGDFLLDFDHADIAFGEIVVELSLPQNGIPPGEQRMWIVALVE